MGLELRISKLEEGLATEDGCRGPRGYVETDRRADVECTRRRSGSPERPSVDLPALFVMTLVPVSGRWSCPRRRYTFTLEAAKQVEPPVYQHFTLNVLQTTSATTATVYANQPFTFDVTTSDTPVNPILTATGFPAGLVLTEIGNSTVVIHGPATTERLSVKTYLVHITATSGSAVSKQILDTTVSS